MSEDMLVDESEYSTTCYVGNTLLISDSELIQYCSQFGKVVDCYHSCYDQTKIPLIDYRFVKYAMASEIENFLQINSHIINSIQLDVRPYADVFDEDVPLALDKKLFILKINDTIKAKDLRKYFREYGLIKDCQILGTLSSSFGYIEFDTTYSLKRLFSFVNKKYKIKNVDIQILRAIRPTDIIQKYTKVKESRSNSQMTDQSTTHDDWKQIRFNDILTTTNDQLIGMRQKTVEHADNGELSKSEKYYIQFRQDFEYLDNKI
ncbi:unnamed protein product [Didymodactylos carnosus]|uniref:RRM domain-containing protein n=1 Tax=Didymodactylos carnosus TaxID=1234261 RepID=A0A813T9C5_9BILA|nr:unnamed protein product [Didymodactylos carnosus]CAF3594276.1 unnamed protein product [Didymodactylos carnosus]